MSSPAPVPTLWTVPKQMVLSCCFMYGRVLQIELDRLGCKDPDGKPLDGPLTLWAIAGNESSWGHNCKPRHEPAYDVGGRYYRESAQQRRLIELYGTDGASSFSPWQILPINALGYKPEELGTDPEKAAQAVIGYLKRYALATRGARTLDQILDTYNSGTWRDEQSPAVVDYVKQGLYYYATEVIAE